MQIKVRWYEHTEAMKKKINAFHPKAFRRLLGITFHQHITSVAKDIKHVIQTGSGTNSNPFGSTDRLMGIVKSCKLRQLGHVTRHDRCTKDVLQCCVKGNRGR